MSERAEVFLLLMIVLVISNVTFGKIYFIPGAYVYHRENFAT
jgi:hypothetical protein